VHGWLHGRLHHEIEDVDVTGRVQNDLPVETGDVSLKRESAIRQERLDAAQSMRRKDLQMKVHVASFGVGKHSEPGAWFLGRRAVAPDRSAAPLAGFPPEMRNSDLKQLLTVLSYADSL
jgi:hypothetical protein